MDADDSEVLRLREENARLKALLARHQIKWAENEVTETESHSIDEKGLRTDTQPTGLSTAEKIVLFRRLFQGRTDVFARRWESSQGKSGYSPACENEWGDGICGKPSVKCAACDRRKLLPLTEQVIFDHLAGKLVIGLYPLLSDDTCHLLAIDFDEGDWKEDVSAFVASCRELSVPCALEVSRSSQGAHVWIFFTSAIPAIEARRLGSALISRTCASRRQLELSSYDRLFPNQDHMPSGGFGNLIALPLQKKAREHGGSVFVDDALREDESARSSSCIVPNSCANGRQDSRNFSTSRVPGLAPLAEARASPRGSSISPSCSHSRGRRISKPS